MTFGPPGLYNNFALFPGCSPLNPLLMVPPPGHFQNTLAHLFGVDFLQEALRDLQMLVSLFGSSNISCTCTENLPHHVVISWLPMSLSDIETQSKPRLQNP